VARRSAASTGVLKFAVRIVGFPGRANALRLAHLAGLASSHEALAERQREAELPEPPATRLCGGLHAAVRQNFVQECH